MPTTAGPSQPKTILIIEDDPLFQEELTGALVGAGYRVENAYDGEAGLQSIRKEAPDLVILDLILPKKQGFEVFREIRSNETTKGIPVVVLSNSQSLDTIVLAIQLGAKACLLKSNLTNSKIVERIRGVLGER